MTSCTYPLLYALDIIEFRYTSISLLNTTRKTQIYMIVAHTFTRALSTQTPLMKGYKNIWPNLDKTMQLTMI